MHLHDFLVLHVILSKTKSLPKHDIHYFNMKKSYDILHSRSVSRCTYLAITHAFHRLVTRDDYSGVNKQVSTFTLSEVKDYLENTKNTHFVKLFNKLGNQLKYAILTTRKHTRELMKDPLNAAGLASWTDEPKKFNGTKVSGQKDPPVSPIHKKYDSDDSDDISFVKHASSPKNCSTLLEDCNTSIYNSCSHVQRNFNNNTCVLCEETYEEFNETVDWLGCPVCDQWYHKTCFHM